MIQADFNQLLSVSYSIQPEVARLARFKTFGTSGGGISKRISDAWLVKFSRKGFY